MALVPLEARRSKVMTFTLASCKKALRWYLVDSLRRIVMVVARGLWQPPW